MDALILFLNLAGRQTDNPMNTRHFKTRRTQLTILFILIFASVFRPAAGSRSVECMSKHSENSLSGYLTGNILVQDNPDELLSWYLETGSMEFAEKIRNDDAVIDAYLPR